MATIKFNRTELQHRSSKNVYWLMATDPPLIAIVEAKRMNGIQALLTNVPTIDHTNMVALGALLVSGASLLFTRRSWLESNRPIVTAEIITHSAGNASIAFSLVVHNIGNRPATNIRLSAKNEDISKIIAPDARPRYADEINRCFTDEALISILNHGKSKKTGFGLTSQNKDQNVLIYGEKLPIKIKHQDLNGSKYKSKITLIVRDSKYFAGSGWAEE